MTKTTKPQNPKTPKPRVATLSLNLKRVVCFAGTAASLSDIINKDAQSRADRLNFNLGLYIYVCIVSHLQTQGIRGGESSATGGLHLANSNIISIIISFLQSIISHRCCFCPSTRAWLPLLSFPRTLHWTLSARGLYLSSC